MTASVQVVVCMDTEGPCADPGNPELLGTWPLVDAAMDKLFAPGFRARYPDPAGGQLKMGWFFLTWTGFRTNPRRRAFGYHAVRDHYLERWGDRIAACGDEQAWHYHHPAASGIGNEWGLDWSFGREYEQILSRQILERGWFPSCYRAGGTIEDAVSSRWVDAWFPVDYSNRAPVCLPGLVDWSTGVAEWGLYHPSPEDFRRPGAGRRRLARTLDLVTGAHVLSESDVEEAFARAAAGRTAILSVFDHDYRDIEGRLDDFRALVQRVSSRYPAVPWRYAAPLQAVWAAVGAPRPRRLELDAAAVDGAVHIWSSEPVHQSIPWLAVRTCGGEVLHVEEGLERLDERRWRWTPAGGLDWVEAGLGVSTDLGASAVARLSPEDGPAAAFLRQPLQRHPTRPWSIWEHSKLFPQLSVGRAAGEAVEMDSVRQALDILQPQLVAGATLLDVGCAAGHLARSLPPGVEYYGIDPYERAIEIGRLLLGREGLPPERLRALALEELPPDEVFDLVVCLSTLYFFPDFRLPLEIMARAARSRLVVRASFGERTEVRYLPDVLLEQPFHAMRAYFGIFSRDDVEAFLAGEGFRVQWVEDRRQRERFGGRPEPVGGIDLPYEFLVAERIAPPPSVDAILGERFGAAAAAWHERGEEGSNP